MFLLIAHSLCYAKADSLETLINNRLDAGLRDLETMRLINEYMIINRESTPKKTIEYGKIAVSFAEKDFPLTIELANTYNRFGNVYFDLGIFDKSIESYFNSLRINRELEEWCNVAWCFNDIGFVYHIQNLSRLALSYYEKALEYALICHYEFPLGHTYGNIGLNI